MGGVGEADTLERRAREEVARLEAWGTGAKPLAFFVPGRIEVLGKHTDYAGGRSLLAATEQGICIAARARTDSRVRIADLTRHLEIEFEMSPELDPRAGHWSNYPETVARRLCQNFPGLQGAEMAFTSNLPRSSGMSSSSALVVAIYSALAAVNRLQERDSYHRAITSNEDLGGYLGAVENGLDFARLPGDRGVGTYGGSEDQTAILCCAPGRLKQYSYCPVRHERTVELPESMVFAVGVCGVHASKAGGAREQYNRASLLASTGAEVWRRETGQQEENLAQVLALGEGSEARLRDILTSATGAAFDATELSERFEHFRVESNEIVPAASQALAEGDVEAFGVQVDRSQARTERMLGNQIDETIHLASAARRHGAAAASAFGAGFGGSVWALIERDQSERFLASWRADYSRSFPQHRDTAIFLTTEAAAAAREIDLDGANG
jgi:galactokinase